MTERERKFVTIKGTRNSRREEIARFGRCNGTRRKGQTCSVTVTQNLNPFARFLLHIDAHIQTSPKFQHGHTESSPWIESSNLQLESLDCLHYFQASTSVLDYYAPLLVVSAPFRSQSGLQQTPPPAQHHASHLPPLLCPSPHRPPPSRRPRAHS